MLSLRPGAAYIDIAARIFSTVSWPPRAKGSNRPGPRRLERVGMTAPQLIAYHRVSSGFGGAGPRSPRPFGISGLFQQETVGGVQRAVPGQRRGVQHGGE